ncbi:MAG: 3-hydroxybutyryl-CoA dehydrogenase [Acidobacteriota bacterium]
MAIKRVGVIGCGLMGSGIAQVCAQSGYETVVREVSDGLLQKGLSSISSFLGKSVEKGKMTPADRDATTSRLRGTTALDELADCDIVIEAITEDLKVKTEIFQALNRLCPESTIFCSNTSSLSMTELAVASGRPARFCGMHFFNPVPIMKLVELVRTITVDEAVFKEAAEFAATLNKTAIAANDSPGFIVNRLLIPYLLDAIRALEEGVGTVDDIDKGMTLGCGHPMGPFTLLDFVGLDTTYYIANIMFDAYKEKRFAPPPLLKRMVLAGWYGKKSGRGFYDYSKKA